MLNVHSYELLSFCWLEVLQNSKIYRESTEQILKVYVCVYFSRLNTESSRKPVSELLMGTRLLVMVRSLVSSAVGIP